jgi:phenylpropionate dioxygenase-like ring-hydroxylating dioxygenase large terminal subunit
MSAGVQPSPAAIDAFNEGLASFWQPVATVESLGEEPLAVELLGRPLALVRLGGEVCAFDDLCRHLGAALSVGEVVDGCLRCRYHGWTYDATGKVVDIPARRGLPTARGEGAPLPGARGVRPALGLPRRGATLGAARVPGIRRRAVPKDALPGL